MLNSLSRFFENRLAPSDDAQDDETRLRIATCALLLEAAHADDEFSDAERSTISQLVGARFQLSEAQTLELLTVADEERRRSGDLYQFARLVNNSFPTPRKLAIVEILWEVVYSDGTLEAHEDALMHKMGTLLGIRHEDLMAVKLKVKRSGS
jgi:uncharacterized tellurite resistance protein B-like protein